MKSGQVALALAGGYLLGRFHKMRLALALAGVAAGKRLRKKGGGLPAGLLNSPEMERLAHDIRGELLAAGRTAAVAAVGSRINELSDKMGERAASLREQPGEAEEGDGEGEGAAPKGKARQGGGGKSRRVSRSRSRTESSTRSRGSARTSTKPSSSGGRTKRTAREEASGGGTTGRPAKRSRG